MNKKFLFAISIAVLTACSNSKTNEKATSQLINVDTASVKSVSDNYSFEYSGTVEAGLSIPLTFKTNGTVEKVLVDIGTTVYKGQLLATIDNSDMLNLCNSMKAKYDLAQDAYNRLKSVYDQGSLPEIKWVEMKSNLEQARSAYELAKNNLRNCNMYAPANGIVGSRNIEPGQSSISLSAPLELVQIENVYVKISVPENEIVKIRQGQKANIHVSALDEKQFEGIVTNVSPVADAISRTYSVKMLVQNHNLELKPGMVCNVKLNTGPSNKILVVSNKAVSRDIDGNTFVYLLTGSHKVKKQQVHIGRYCSSGIEVISGLTEGQVVVCNGFEKVSDNSLISY